MPLPYQPVKIWTAEKLQLLPRATIGPQDRQSDTLWLDGVDHDLLDQHPDELLAVQIGRGRCVPDLLHLST